MRLSFTKTLIMSTLAFVFLAVILVLCFIALPKQSAAADYEYSISGLESKTKQYGDLFDETVDATGKIYGILDSNFVFKVGEGNDCYILADDIKARPSGSSELVSLCKGGLIYADVLSGGSSKYYLTDEDGFHAFYEPIQIYLTESGDAYANRKIYYNKVGKEIIYTVLPREITVAYNAEASHVGDGASGDPLSTEEKDGVLYINHTYGALPDTIAFAEKAGSAKVMTDEFEDDTFYLSGRWKEKTAKR